MPVILLIKLCGIQSEKEILNWVLLDKNEDSISEYLLPFFQYKSIYDNQMNDLNPIEKITNYNIYDILKKYLESDIFGVKQEFEDIHKTYIHNYLSLIHI